MSLLYYVVVGGMIGFVIGNTGGILIGIMLGILFEIAVKLQEIVRLMKQKKHDGNTH